MKKHKKLYNLPITGDDLTSLYDYLAMVAEDCVSSDKAELKIIERLGNSIRNLQNEIDAETSKTKPKKAKKKEVTDDDFYDKYTLASSVKSKNFEAAGQFETYGADVEYVMAMATKHPKRVWTVIEGEEHLWIVAGYRTVNRFYYIITNEEAESEEETYRVLEVGDE